MARRSLRYICALLVALVLAPQYPVQAAGSGSDALRQRLEESARERERARLRFDAQQLQRDAASRRQDADIYKSRGQTGLSNAWKGQARRLEQESRDMLERSLELQSSPTLRLKSSHDTPQGSSE